MSDDRAKALPAPGTTATTRNAQAPPTEALSVEDASVAYGLSQSTIYRRLHKGDVPGAYKVQTSQGEAWRIPLGSLEYLGYSRDEAAEITAPTPSAAPEAFGEVVAQLSAIIERNQRQIEAAEADRGAEANARIALEVRAATAEAKLDSTRENVEKLEAEVERLRTRRGWFRRRSD